MVGPVCPSKGVWKAFIHYTELLNSPIFVPFRGHSLRVELGFLGLLKGLKHPLFANTDRSSEVIYTRSSSVRPISSTIVSTSFLDPTSSPSVSPIFFVFPKLWYFVFLRWYAEWHWILHIWLFTCKQMLGTPPIESRCLQGQKFGSDNEFFNCLEIFLTLLFWGMGAPKIPEKHTL